MSTYKVTATRWAEGWELDIADVGVTQASSLSAAERMIRSYLAMDGHADAHTASIDYTFPDFDVELVSTMTKVRTAEKAQIEATRASRMLVRKLHKSGLKGAEIAKMLEVSPQRVSQILASGSAARRVAAKGAGKVSEARSQSKA